MASDPLAERGSLLTATEAERLAMQFGTGTSISVAVRDIAISRREHVRELLAASGIAPSDRERAVSVLRAIAGGKTLPRELTPVWSMPGNEASIGHLTSEFHRIVGAARQSR